MPALLALVASLVVAACGGSSQPTASPSSSARSASSATPDPTKAAVLRAYLAHIKAIEDADATADYASAALAATTVDPLLHQLRLNLVTNSNTGIVGRGSSQHHPQVESISGNTATVVDCLYSQALLIYVKTGQPVPNQPGGTQPEWDLLHATLVQVSPGVWKASASDVKLGAPCQPAG